MTPLGPRRLLAGLLLLTGSLASVDAITGQGVGPTGPGVVGVDIDFVSAGGGGNPLEWKDGTDTNVSFTTAFARRVVDPSAIRALAASRVLRIDIR